MGRGARGGGRGRLGGGEAADEAGGEAAGDLRGWAAGDVGGEAAGDFGGWAGARSTRGARKGEGERSDHSLRTRRRCAHDTYSCRCARVMAT